MNNINSELSKKTAARNEYDTTIQETEAAYMKVREAITAVLAACCCSTVMDEEILLCFVSCSVLQILESSQTLLNVLKRESVSLHKKRQVSQ